MENFFSPLRYPGGKGKMSLFFKTLLEVNNLNGCHYYEPYAGGAAVALHLLLSNSVNKITLNDGDYHIYAFWNSLLNDTEQFLKKIHHCTISINAWKRHRDVYLFPEKYTELEVGFSTFFLNRCNRSGILTKAGPIGGIEQNGNYLIDARFNKISLKKRIEAIAIHSSKISIFNLDTLAFLKSHKIVFSTELSLIYLDPPYYRKGSSLYLNHYNHNDHVNISEELNSMRNCKWIVTYDNVPEIDKIYNSFRKTIFFLNYSLQKTRKASEIMILSDNINIPSSLNTKGYNNYLNMVI